MENQVQQEAWTILKLCSTEEDFKLYDEVQIKVFVEGQKIDIDAVMEKTGDLQFYIFYADDEVVGSIRYNHTENGYKIQRVAILPEHRRKGLGKKMLLAIVEEIKKVIKEGEIIYSEIQHQTKEFYLACGFDVDTSNARDIQNILHYDATLDVFKQNNNE